MVQSSEDDRPARKRRWYVPAATLTAVSLLVYIFWTDFRVPASGVTGVNMKKTALCINRYRSAHGACPERLSDMVPLPDEDESVLLDGWGRELAYRVNTDATVTLYSYGRDGEPGGTGEDADISMTYDSDGRVVDG